MHSIHEIGAKLAEAIPVTSRPPSSYLPALTINSFFINPVTFYEIEHEITKLGIIFTRWSDVHTISIKGCVTTLN